MVYNLLNKANITTTGGNKSLSETEIGTLYDYITTSGVTLVNSDILHLNIDLGDRYPITGINIYTDSLTTSGISVQYKEFISDDYVDLTVVSGVDYLYTSLDTYFNPRYLLCTFSGVSLNLHEISILSSLYDVSYGTTGQQSVLDIGDVDSTYELTPITSLSIYNNNAVSRTIYSHIAYDGVNYLHNKLLINSTSGTSFHNATYNLLGIIDYTNGIYDSNIEVSDVISLVDPQVDYFPTYTLSGTYTSPLVIFDSTNVVSYIDLVSSEEGDCGIDMYAKSSNTAPLPYYEFFTVTKTGYLYRYNTEAEGFTHNNISSTSTKNILVNNEGHIFVFDTTLKVYDRTSAIIYSSGLAIAVDYKVDWCSDYKSAWAYDRVSGSLKSMFLTYNNTEVFYTRTSPYQDEVDFVKDFSVSKYIHTDVWYIDNVEDKVVCVDIDGVDVAEFFVTSPNKVCATDDGYCWVSAESVSDTVRILKLGLDYSVEEFYIDVPFIDTMCFDPVTKGFFFSNRNYIYRFDGTTSTLIDTSFKPDLIEYIEHEDHLVLSSNSNNKIKVVNATSSETITELDLVAGTTITQPKAYFKPIANGETPRTLDKFWSSYNSDWYALDKTGGNLKKFKYHQLRFDLTTNDYYSKPEIFSIKHGKVLEKNVLAYDSTDFYIKYTDVSSMSNDSYEATFVTHWEDN